MPISWNEIRQNAIAFSKRWADESRESAERQTFWNELFEVFGQKRRLVASFEEPVKKLSGSWGAIDLFWKGTMLAEHKTRGQDLGKAHAQAIGYIQGLKNTGREDEIPRYVVVSDFALIAIHDLEDGTSAQFPLADFYKHADKFAFIPGYKRHKLAEENPIDIKAVRRLGLLHDALENGGYTGHHLERFLVRILFCVFAEDTGLFDRNALTDFVEHHTREDGSDLGGQLARFFQVLNTPDDRRQTNLLEELAALPYVNGDLFAEALDFADFNRAMRDRLLNCCRFDWSRISPAVFGSLFQSVMNSAERRQDGAHYTTERDILKLVRSLFLDDLRVEFDRLAASKGTRRDANLREFHARLGTLKFLDPACGCGNFLVVTYRELRLLEIDVLLALHGTAAQMVLDVSALSVVDVDAMYGIEINEFPAQIAQVAMWLIDHQMNQRLSEAFGQNVVRLPLKKSATIRHGNALRTDWADVLPPAKCAYVLGNPPFVGGKYQTAAQRADLEFVAGGVKNSGLLDFVALWYLKAADYVRGTAIPVAFVSTNSITQGEQVGVLWGELFRRGATIHFAHRTFAWQSEAAGKAHVHVVIVGFGMVDKPGKRIFDYDSDPRTPTVTTAKNISPYLVEGPNVAVSNRSTPLCPVPQLLSGNQPIDDGNYLFTTEERDEFIRIEPASVKWFRRWLGADEFINGWERWCLWLGDCPPNELRAMPEAMKRVEAVQVFRSQSQRVSTLKLAKTPTRFQVETIPITSFLVIPEVSSERRQFIPIGFMTPETIVSNLVRVLKDATLYHFGVLTSSMHMAWVRLIGGRLKSDYRYSVKLVYNNYPWPHEPAVKLRAAVEAKAAGVLAARARHPAASLADLYDPLTMPADLTKAHAELDRAVERCYRPEAFAADRDRVEFLFAEYERLTNPLTAGLDAKPKAARRAAKPTPYNDADYRASEE
jgi:hypothetical protein